MHLMLSVILNRGPDTNTPDPPAILPNEGDNIVRSVEKEKNNCLRYSIPICTNRLYH